MTDKLEAQLNRGAQAQRLLNDPLLKEALDAIERKHLEDWKLAATPDAREQLHHGYQAALLFRGLLTAAIQNGNFAKTQLDQIAAQQKRNKR